jgi:hypothetical protein
MFSSIGKGAPAAVKAAIIYNDLLRFWGLDKNIIILFKVIKLNGFI